MVHGHGTDAEEGLSAGHDYIRLNYLKYPVPGGSIQVTPTARFEGKIVSGDYSLDSDPVLSADVTSDLSGGGQIYDRAEGTDQGRYWWGQGLELRNPKAITLGREVVAVDVYQSDGTTPLTGTADAAPAADLDGAFYGFYDTTVTQWDETNAKMVAIAGATIAYAVVNDPVAYGAAGAGTSPVLWLPYGANGYATFDGATVTVGPDTITPVDFLSWDRRLWALSHDGRFSEYTGASWTEHTNARIDLSETPRHLLYIYDQRGAPQMAAVTSRGLFHYDTDFDTWRPTSVLLPPHPDNGLAAEVWAGGGLGDEVGGNTYVAAATQVYQHVPGSTANQIGPQRDQGLPAEFRGRIRSMAAEHNGLYCLLEGQSTASAAPITDYLETGDWSSDEMYGGSAAAYASLLYWTTFGWHTLWVPESPGGTPSRVQVSGANDAYRLWWGYGGTLYTVALPTDFHLPRLGLQAGIDRFQLHGFVETGFFDAQMEGFRKTASHLRVNLAEMPLDEDDVALCALSVSYQKDFDEGWTPLGDTLTTRGKRSLSFGFEGLVFERIRFRIELSSSSATASPLLKGVVLHYRKVPYDRLSWTIPIDLNFTDAEKWGRSARQMRVELTRLLSDAEFIRLTIDDEDFRVALAFGNGPQGLAPSAPGTMTLSLIEIKDEEDDEAVS